MIENVKELLANAYSWIEYNRSNDLKAYINSLTKEDIKGVKPEEWEKMGVSELVYYPKLKEIMDENRKNKGGKEALLKAIEDNALELVPKHVTKSDIFASA